MKFLVIISIKLNRKVLPDLKSLKRMKMHESRYLARGLGTQNRVTFFKSKQVSEIGCSLTCVMLGCFAVSKSICFDD